MYHKIKFTPRRWNSEDGLYSFYQSESGATDILPGPNSEVMKRLYAAFPEYKNILNRPKPYSNKDAHVHWAMKPKEEE